MLIAWVAILVGLIGFPVRDLSGGHTFLERIHQRQIGLQFFGCQVRMASAPDRVVDLDALARIGLARFVFDGGGDFKGKVQFGIGLGKDGDDRGEIDDAPADRTGLEIEPPVAWPT